MVPLLSAAPQAQPSVQLSFAAVRPRPRPLDGSFGGTRQLALARLHSDRASPDFSGVSKTRRSNACQLPPRGGASQNPAAVRTSQLSSARVPEFVNSAIVCLPTSAKLRLSVRTSSRWPWAWRPAEYREGDRQWAARPRARSDRSRCRWRAGRLSCSETPVAPWYRRLR